MKCKLCETNDLDNTGAHFITESIARSAISERGSKGRDNEIFYSFSVSTLGKSFIGRNINEDKVKEIKGRVLTQEELVGNENMLIDFNLVCRSCENKFNPIETHFIAEILRKKIETNINEKEIELDEYDYRTTLLFLIINLWRTSASEKTHYKLNGIIEEELRTIINQIQRKPIDETLSEIDFSSGILSSIKFATYYLVHTDGDKTENQICLSSDTVPHTFIINQVVFLIFYEYPITYRRDKVLSEITSKSKINKTIVAQPDSMIVRCVNNKKRLKTLNIIAKEQVKALSKKVNYIIKKTHLSIYGFEAHRDIYVATKNEISKLPKEDLNQHSINAITAKYLLLSGEYYKKYGRPYK